MASDRPVSEQVELMHAMVADDLAMYDRKAKEYGSADLEVMGAAMATLLDMGNPEDGVEAAIAFYALGKIARAFGAFKLGQLPSDDTWKDLTVYSLMVRERRTR